MQYLIKDDLITYAQERFIDDSSQDDTDILDSLELAQIAIVRSYLSSRYNVNLIFSPESPIENEVLKSIIIRLLLYKLFRRNAARVVPTNSKEDYDAAMKELIDISTGRITLNELPAAGSGDNGSSGQPSNSNSLWGNNTNPDFYI